MQELFEDAMVVAAAQPERYVTRIYCPFTFIHPVSLTFR